MIGTSTKELERSEVTGESSQMLDTEFPEKNEEIEGDGDEGVDKEQESNLVVTKGKMNLTRTKTKSPNAGYDAYVLLFSVRSRFILFFSPKHTRDNDQCILFVSLFFLRQLFSNTLITYPLN